MLFGYASAPIILASDLKDQFIIDFLESWINNLTKLFFGIQSHIRLLYYVTPLSKLLYYGSIMIFSKDKRTLGEEYANIMMIDSKEKALPSLNTRIAYLIAFSLYPSILERIQAKLKEKIELELETKSNFNKQEMKNETSFPFPALLSTLPLSMLMELIQNVLIPLHTSLFYLNGRYSDWTRRLFGLRFIHYPRRIPESIKANNLYKIFSLVLSIISILKAIKIIKEFIEKKRRIEMNKSIKNRKNENENENQSNLTVADTGNSIPSPHQNEKCSLCLEEFKNKTMTRCSHFFCWNCIVVWLLSLEMEKRECPLCRSPCHLSQIFLVYNV